MRIPRARRTGAMHNFDKANAFLYEPPRRQQLFPKRFSLAVLETV